MLPQLLHRHTSCSTSPLQARVSRPSGKERYPLRQWTAQQAQSVRQRRTRCNADAENLSEKENVRIDSFSTSWLELIQSATHQQWVSLWELTRIHNYVPSCLLVLVGAWKASDFSWMAFCSIRVWIMALIAAGVAVGSVVVNDYFDFLIGVDTVNAPERPLPSGIIRPDIALLVTLLFYVTVLVAGCIMEPPALRWIIAFSAATTLLYTPFLKSLTLVKNIFVASVTSLSPISGALAAGTGSVGVQNVLRVSGFLMGVIIFREILMDIGDTEGDAAAHIYTIPVILGRPMGLCIALFFLFAGTVVGAHHLPNATIVHFFERHVAPSTMRFVASLLFGVVLWPLYARSFQIWRRGFDKTLLQSTIDRAIICTAFGFLFVVLFG